MICLTPVFADTKKPSSSKITTAMKVVVEPYNAEEIITDLQFNSDEMPVRTDGRRRTVELGGEFDREGWSLLVKSTQIPIRKGKFKLSVPIQREVTILQFRAVGPAGEIERQIITLRETNAAVEGRPGRYELIPYLGVTAYSYKQTGFSDFTQNGVTGKLTGRYIFPSSRWDISGSAFMTLLPFGASRSTLTTRFLGLNLRAGYTLPGLEDPWSLILMGGLYYTTMMVSGTEDIGYTNYFAPQIFPALRYRISPQSALGLYFKFAPILDGLRLKSLSDRELASGIGYSWTTESGSSWSIQFDYAQLEASGVGVTSSSSSYSLGLAYTP